jgi:hypothetical protein
MQCRNCGTEIADKALICYRCGTATTEPTFKPAAPGRERSGTWLVSTVIALVLLVLLVPLALYMGRVPSGEAPRFATGAVVAVALLVVALRAYARRR